jgi:hypothetical protein
MTTNCIARRDYSDCSNMLLLFVCADIVSAARRASNVVEIVWHIREQCA